MYSARFKGWELLRVVWERLPVCVWYWEPGIASCLPVICNTSEKSNSFLFSLWSSSQLAYVICWLYRPTTWRNKLGITVRSILDTPPYTYRQVPVICSDSTDSTLLSSYSNSTKDWFVLIWKTNFPFGAALALRTKSLLLKEFDLLTLPIWIQDGPLFLLCAVGFLSSIDITSTPESYLLVCLHHQLNSN